MTKAPARIVPGVAARRRDLAALLMATTMLACPAAMTTARAQAPAPGTLPQGGQVTAGQSSILQSGNQLTVTQASQRAVINWQSYSIGAAAGVTYAQPNTAAISLNRVVGNDPSQIFGSLRANGQVWLVNPNGILFGRSARIDVAGLVAATSNITMSDQEFVAGTSGLVAFGRPGRADAAIVNQGEITVREAGLAAFVAPAVANQGTITARLGRVSLASANTFTLDLYGDRLVNLAVDDRVVGNARDAQGNTVAAGVENSGRIMAEGGRIALSAQVARGVVDSVVRNSGVLDVSTATVTRGGTIILSGGDGAVEVTGSVNASGRGPGQRGGRVHVQGGAIRIAPTVTIDVAGDVDGGAVRLMARGTVEVAGTVDARGTAGAGGRVAASGNLVFLAGRIDARGRRGGTVTIDSGVTIQAGTVAVDGDDTGGAIAINAARNVAAVAGSALSATGGTRGGTVTIESGGAVFSSGAVLASSHAGAGGSVDVFAPQISLVGATIDASGATAGGAVRIGGDRGGLGDAPHAEIVRISGTTTISADASDQGPGGTVVVWSDSETRVSGALSARGGPNGGDGGFIEISSAGQVAFGGTADASSVRGAPGTVLLDPKFIVIEDSPRQGLGYDLLDPLPATGNSFGAIVDQVFDFSNNAIVNLVVTDPTNSAIAANAGAVYVFNGINGRLVSVLTGDQAGDRIGGFINMNFQTFEPQFLTGSTSWHGNRGAITWLDANVPFHGVVSAGNSLVGGTPGDQVGSQIGTINSGQFAFLIGSPNWTNPATNAANAGALTYLYAPSGVTGVVGPTNSLVGDHANDRIGDGLSFGIQFLGNGNVNVTIYDVALELPKHNLVVRAPTWNGNRGAVTFIAANTPLVGTVSAANSLVGAQAGDQVGSLPVVVNPTTGLYVVQSPNWANGAATGAGAMTMGNATSGIAGVVGPANSIVGSTAGDGAGNRVVVFLTNGNAVITTPGWDNGAIVDAGAVTWMNANGSTVGAISALNSVVGGSANDQVGRASSVRDFDFTFQLFLGIRIDPLNLPVIPLSNGNYVIATPTWRNPATNASLAGAVTWVDGTTGRPSDGLGLVSAANSLVGTRPGEVIGAAAIATVTISGQTSTYYANGVRALANGNYVVDSGEWHHIVPGISDDPAAGAVTWVNGTNGQTMDHSNLVSAANSLVGSITGDMVGARNFASASSLTSFTGLMLLPNGNYIVESSAWNHATGAVTWGNGATGTAGVVGTANSLIGSTAGDQVGLQIDPSTNNGYPGVIRVPGTSNVFVLSSEWRNTSTAAANAGAISFIDGTTGRLADGSAGGAVSAANSLIGQHSGDLVGLGGTIPPLGTQLPPAYVFLGNGSIAFLNPSWANGGAAKAGAVTVMDPAHPTVGAITAANSLIGSQTGDMVGIGGINGLAGGFYAVISPNWANGAASGAGAVTIFNQNAPPVGAVSTANSVIGSHSGDHVGALASGSTAVRRLGLSSDPSFSNFLILGDQWNGGRGAVTLIVTNGTSWDTLDGNHVVGPTNSLVGSLAGDHVGADVAIVSNGSYWASTRDWNGGRGAVTWSSGLNPGAGVINVVGEVSQANSLVGSQAGDHVGSGFIYTFALVGVPPTALIVSPDWSNGTTANVGAVTFAPANQPITGVVSPANSLIGATAGDRIGSGGVEYSVERGIAYVKSPSFNNGGLQNAGAVTVIAVATGQTFDQSHVVSTGNSIVGTSANAHLRFVSEIEDFNDPSTLRFVTQGAGGQVTIGFTALEQLRTVDFALAPNSTMYIPPGVIAGLLRGGQNVLLQANTDISLLSPLTVNDPRGHGGRLTLDAGRSVIIDASIVTDNGDLVIVANDSAANGVETANRDPGAANITMAQGVAIDAGTGFVSFTIGEGTGRTGAAAQGGDITLGAITAGSILAQNLGHGSDVILNGPLTASGGGNAIVLATVFGNFINNYGPNAVSAPDGRWLIYSRRLEFDTRNGLTSGNPDLVPYSYLDNPPATLSGDGQGGNRYLLSGLATSPPPPSSPPPPPASAPPPPPPISQVPPPPPALVEGPATDQPHGDTTQNRDLRFDRVSVSGPFGFTATGIVAQMLGLTVPVDVTTIAPAAGGTAGPCAISAEAWANAFLQAGGGAATAASLAGCAPPGPDPR